MKVDRCAWPGKQDLGVIPQGLYRCDRGIRFRRLCGRSSRVEQRISSDGKTT